MNKIKKFSVALLSAFICCFSAIIFAGCNEDVEYSKLYVFSTVGGDVQVNDEIELVKPGDEGSKPFSFKEDSIVHLKAIANEGYSFVKWEYSDDLGDKYRTFSSHAEIDLIMDEDIISIKAIFAESASIGHSINYTNGAGYNIIPQGDSGLTVPSNGTFSFKVNVLEGYDASTLSVQVNGINIVAEDGIYYINEINEDKNITIIVKKKKFAVTLNNGVGYTLVADGDATSVEYGSTFKFSLELSEKFSNSDVVVKAKSKSGDVAVLSLQNGKYSLRVDQNYEILVEGVVEDKYTVTLPNVASVNIQFTDASIQVSDNKIVVVEGDSLSFSVNSTNDEYDLSNVIVKADYGAYQSTLTANNGIYSLTNIASDVAIVISNIKVITYTVSESDDKFSIVSTTGSLQTTKGGNVSFIVKFVDGYVAGDSFKVYANGTELTPSGNVYTVENITQNVTIVASGIELANCVITLPEDNDKYTVEVEAGYTTTVEYGKEFKFRVNVSDKYSVNNLVVKANGSVITSSDGVYVIDSVKGNIVITVEGEMLEIYNVTLPSSEMYSIEPEQGYTTNVVSNSDFKFKVVINSGYIKGLSFDVEAEGYTISEEDGVYTISNVTSDVEIEVKGVGSPIGIFWSDDINGCTITPLDGYTLNVIAGDEFKFTIEIAEGCGKSSNFEVTANQQTLEDEGGVYTISNISEQVIIYVTGVVQLVNVTFEQPSDENVRILYNGEVVTSVELEIESNLEFTVETKTGFADEISIQTNVDGQGITLCDPITEGDVTSRDCIISSIDQNLTITVAAYKLYDYVMDYSNTSTYEVILNECAPLEVSLKLDLLNMPENNIDGSGVIVNLGGEASTLKLFIDEINTLLEENNTSDTEVTRLNALYCNDEVLVAIEYEEDGTYVLTFYWDIIEDDSWLCIGFETVNI